MKKSTFGLKPHQLCSRCKREIDQDGAGPDKSRRLGLIEDGGIFCRLCAYGSCQAQIPNYLA